MDPVAARKVVPDSGFGTELVRSIAAFRNCYISAFLTISNTVLKYLITTFQFISIHIYQPSIRFKHLVSVSITMTEQFQGFQLPHILDRLVLGIVS
jgi:hypothetical protein